ncbi:superoxide dismutase [Paucibacter sp. DJ4R-1]|nr:superoxide dismutase [Paucibacter sp. DJ4R-1]
MSQVTLPDLPYAYDALEPFISEEIMTLHHKKHHQTYVNGYNTALQNLSKLVSDSSTARQQIALQAAIKFNGGGHINHSLFWKNLAPETSSDSKPKSAPTLSDAIKNSFGENFQKEFNAAALGIQGSGWAWLVYHPSGKRLEIITTPNQDPVLPPYVPIFGVDMWEHAFYLQYKNVKPDYLSAIWNVINWKEAEKRYTEGQSAKL